MKTASWVIVDKWTNKAVCELFSGALVAKINTAKYKAVPILDYLVNINGAVK